MAERGLSPDQIIAALRSYDPHFDDYRQVGIVTADGAVAAHSPPKGLAYTGHKLGDGFLAMGNGLACPEVVEAIHDGFSANAGEAFPERLVRAIEAGYAAGGEAVGQKSAGLIVTSPQYDRPLVDLRIDMASPLPTEGGDAVRDLRRVFDAYKPLIPLLCRLLARQSYDQGGGLRPEGSLAVAASEPLRHCRLVRPRVRRCCRS